MTDLEQRQRERESRSVDLGINRMLEEIEMARSVGREYDLPVGAQRIYECVMQMRKPLRAKKAEARKKIVKGFTSGQRLAGWETLILTLSEDKLAYLTVRALLNTFHRDDKRPQAWVLSSLTQSIGYHVWLEARYEAMRAEEREKGSRDLARLQRRVKARNPRSVRTWLRRLDYAHLLQDSDEWGLKNRTHLGTQLIEVLLGVPSCPFERSSARLKGKLYVTVQMRKEWEEQIVSAYRDMAMALPIRRPMLCSPAPWTWTGDQFSGGYLTDGSASFLVGARLGGTAAQEHLNDQTVSSEAIAAVNAVQSVAFRVNKPVLEFMQKAYEEGIEKFGCLFDIDDVQTVADKLPQPEFDALSAEDRSAYIKRRAAAHNAYHRQRGKRLTLSRILNEAEGDAQHSRIYFPHGLDWRHRVYPLTQEFHMQANDFTKALITFADEKPLGENGMNWLAFHAANCYGMDKLNREQQLEWFNEHTDTILTVASDPLGDGFDFLQNAAEPWQFLAACMEICRVQYEAEQSGRDVSEVGSSLPVFVDGTCNGLQHLSAMGRDRAGAVATNLTSNTSRQDIYQIVADQVEWLMENETDPIHGGKVFSEGYQYWNGRVDRAVVKRGVMTVPYGLTKIGMKDQLMKDGWTDDEPMARYLSEKMGEAIHNTVKSAALIMEWLQFNVSELARLGIPFVWPTPDGSEVTQAYWATPFMMITTNLGQLRVLRPGKHTDSLLVNKQTHGIVPNLIHSFDAAHLTLTVTDFMEEPGRAVAVVHDSFGTHACDMDELLASVKWTFASIYRYDWMEAIQREFKLQAPVGVNLREPPAMGDWDPEEVLGSEFFFC